MKQFFSTIKIISAFFFCKKNTNSNPGAYLGKDFTLWNSINRYIKKYSVKRPYPIETNSHYPYKSYLISYSYYFNDCFLRLFDFKGG